MELQHWTDVYHWAKSNKQILHKKFDDITENYCPVGENICVTEEQIKIIKEMRWNIFDQYKKL